jgi:hypothetical protein
MTDLPPSAETKTNDKNKKNVDKKMIQQKNAGRQRATKADIFKSYYHPASGSRYEVLANLYSEQQQA